MYVAVRLHWRDPATRGLKFIIATGEPALRALTRIARSARNWGKVFPYPGIRMLCKPH
jgi:hypothetical protein